MSLSRKSVTLKINGSLNVLELKAIALKMLSVSEPMAINLENVECPWNEGHCPWKCWMFCNRRPLALKMLNVLESEVFDLENDRPAKCPWTEVVDLENKNHLKDLSQGSLNSNWGHWPRTEFVDPENVKYPSSNKVVELQLRSTTSTRGRCPENVGCPSSNKD